MNIGRPQPAVPVGAEAARERSPRSSGERLKIQLPEGRSAELVGKIDRVDLSEDGEALVIDYKTGSCPDMKGIDNGTLLQAPLYMLALESIFGLKPHGAEYRSLKKLDAKGFDVSQEDFDEKMQSAISAAQECVFGIMSARFPLKPERGCGDFCSFESICRVDDRVRSTDG
jgi:ATP-dependent helicase/DNAse subunit B